MELQRQHTAMPRRTRYRSPSDIRTITLPSLLAEMHRPALEARQLDFLASSTQDGLASIYYSGDLSALRSRAISIVGTREVSDEGRRRARKLARELVAAGITIVSGLAKGVDTAALTAAIDAGGRTAAVIGTPLDKAYPAENATLQELIYGEHLLLTPFAIGERTFKGNFPKRNRVMAAISDATVIVEASDTSGTLHQAAECGRLKRWLFIMRSVADDPSLTWPKNFINKPKVAVISSTQDILDAIET
ncbi:DNA-processing protein DprA [Methylobacterium gossipiicola]|nr:DNA-processing protein DprA [Methylobacterium gossipiicola]